MSSIDLSEYDEAYAEAPIKSFGGVPEGLYTVIVSSVCIKDSRAGDPMLVWEFEVVGGEYRGSKVTKRDVIKHDKLSFIKTDLAICGLTLKSFSELPKKLNHLLDLQLDVRVKVKGEYTNVYIMTRSAPHDPSLPY